MKIQFCNSALKGRIAAMTLAEVVVALAITGLAVVGIVNGYVYCAASSQKAALALAASARATERLEQTRSAKWDLAVWPAVDQLVASNFPSQPVLLDISGSGVGVTTGTVDTVITDISANPPLKSIRVNCTWVFRGARITNSIETCRSPNQ